MEAAFVPRGSFGHFNAGKAGGDDTAVDDQEQTAADGETADDGIDDFFDSVHDS
jgi:hypothetical protein